MNSLPIIDMVRTGQNINNLRKRKGLSVEQIRIMYGFNTPQAIYKWFRGASLPTIDNLVILAHILETGIDEIIVLQKGD